MILNDLYTEIAGRTSLTATDTNDQARILSAAVNQMKRLYLTTSLDSEREVFTLTTVVGQYLYTLDPRVLRSINFRETTSPNKLNFQSRKSFEKDHPNITVANDSGLMDTYVPMRKVRVSNQPSSASRISIVSSSASDITTYYVVVKGYDSTGQLYTERLLLTGTTPVLSSNTYTTLLSISKSTTNGNITATSNSGTVTNIFLTPGEREREQWEILLYKIPDQVYTILYSAQVIPWYVKYAEDLLPIPNEMAENFMAMVTSEVLGIQGDPKVAFWENKAKTLKDEIKDQSFLGEDDDARFGFEEVSYPKDFT